MMEKRQLKKVYRYHRISHNETFEALISLNKDCIWVKIDSLFDVPALRKTRIEIYVALFDDFCSIRRKIRQIGISKKLTDKISKVLINWEENDLFLFSEDGKLIVNGGQKNDK